MTDLSKDAAIVDLSKSRPRVEIVEPLPDRALGDHVGETDASQRAGLPDIHYIWGPGRLLASQILGVSGVAILLSIALSLSAFGFALDTLGLLFGRFPKGF
jgi:hypothetical protein